MEDFIACRENEAAQHFMKKKIRAERRVRTEQWLQKLAPMASPIQMALALVTFVCLGVNAQQSGPTPALGRSLPASVYVNPETKNQKLFSKEGLQSPASNRPDNDTSVEAVAASAASFSGDLEKRGYALTENDLISVKVYQEPDLDSMVRVAKDGTVNYWLLGNIHVGGKGVQETTRLIRDRLAKDYLVNPQVNVTIVEYAKREFTILGAIERPGTYVIPEGRPLSLQQAVALAGGYKPGAKKGKVTVTRWANGQKLIQKVNADAFARDKDSKPFVILPDDHITVDESFF
jgi:protein involved in polysaccharide export with SLBB domain